MCMTNIKCCAALPVLAQFSQTLVSILDFGSHFGFFCVKKICKIIFTQHALEDLKNDVK